MSSVSFIHPVFNSSSLFLWNSLYSIKRAGLVQQTDNPSMQHDMKIPRNLI